MLSSCCFLVGTPGHVHQHPVDRLTAALVAIASTGCESFTSGNCYTNGRTEVAQYLADRVCDPCRAWRALFPETEVGA